ncbi:MAG TPA: adenosylcobinamide-GDP ribazoletransferase [Chloroflexota bacterium]|nr:adenosylcobinamide-GDP ribazoletransferase [Chloroflexota bacterium]
MLAWTLLTVVPTPRLNATPRALAGSAAFFPLVGAALGAALGGLGMVAERLLPPGPTAALLLAAGALVTGGLHLDGLMDTADGVFGGRTRERRLEIMRDSRVGAYGALAAGLALLGQYACLVELGRTERLLALVVALTLGRWAMALALGLFPAARTDGLGAAYRAEDGRAPAAVATLLALAVVAAVAAASATGTAAERSAAATGLALVVALGGGRWLAGRLGGLTGDAYGALCVLAETAALYAAVALR